MSYIITMTRTTKKRTAHQKYYTYLPYVSVCSPVKNKISTLKKIMGVSCLVIAVLPNGLGVIFYPLGFGLLGITRKTLLKAKKSIKADYNYYKKRFQNGI